MKDSHGWTVWKVSNPNQFSPSLTILVSFWFIIISLVFFYLCKVLLSDFSQFNGNFVDGQNNVPVNSKTAHAPPGKPRGIWLFWKILVKFPAMLPVWRSNVPPVRASKRVKSPTLQACEANCRNKFCKIFSHYEFLVQLVFAPHFKQMHIPR